MDADAALYATLQQSMSPVDSVRKPAEQQLKEFENAQGFIDVLLRIAAAPEAELNVRIMAVICIKVSSCQSLRPEDDVTGF